MTASAPCRRPSSPRITGMPPPPAQMTMAPSAQQLPIVASSTMATGSGDATTRRQAVAVGPDLPAPGRGQTLRPRSRE